MDNFNNMEAQFTPSLWSSRFATSQEVLENHIKFTTEKTETNKIIYNYKSNIPYGEHEKQKYDIYYKGNEFGSPIFVFVHGGYWQELDKNISGYCVGPLIEQGYRVIILGYSLCPQVKLKQITDEIQTAISKICQYAIETEAMKLSLCGHSAGAHLLATCLLRCPQLPKLNLLKSVILISGIYDLTDLWKTNAVNPQNILGLDEFEAIELSQIYHKIAPDIKEKLINTKFLIYAGEEDSDIFKKQSELFNVYLSISGISSNLQILTGYDHFNIVENLTSNEYEITKLIIRNL